MSELVRHLSNCGPCRAVVAAEFDQKPRLPWIVAAIAGATSLIVIAWLIASMRPPERRMIAAMSRTPRPISARLTDLPWSPLRQRARSASSQTEDYALKEAASHTLQQATAARRVAIAHLVFGKRDDAITVLRTHLKDAANDAESWSDLGAILHEVVVSDGRWNELPTALAAADRALRIAPKLPQARFNRALILDTLGLRRHAATAWLAYLTIEPSGSWAEEARDRLAKTGATLSRSDVFRRRLEQLDAANAAAVRAVVAEYPQQARTTGETILLHDWGKAEIEGRADAMAKSLAMARAIGAALLQTNREALLSETVAAIDSATPGERRVLAVAHITYFDARQRYSQKKAREAQPMLIEAARQFASASSPMADVANYYAANTLYDTGAIGESSGLLREIAARLPEHGHEALDGQVHWELGLCETTTGNWTAAITAYTRAIERFERLGERGNLAFVRNLLAGVLEHIGDREEAWNQRRLVYLPLSEEGFGNRLQVAIGSAARAELDGGRLDAARSLFDLEIAETAGVSNSERLANAYARRAIALGEGGEAAAAADDLRSARATAARLSDPAVRANVLAAADVADAILARNDAPAHALQALARAKAVYESGSRQVRLPLVALETARALRRLGRDDEARAEVDVGVAEIERQRATVGPSDQRLSVFDAAEELFHEAIDIAVERGDFAAAFRYAERARARTLLESVAARRQSVSLTPASAASVQLGLAPGTMLVEFAILKNRLVIFCLTRYRLHGFVVPIDREELRQRTHSFTTAVRSQGAIASVDWASDRVSEVLLQKAASLIGESATVVFVPDRFLQLVPFAALRLDGRYLIERHAVVVSPSGTLFAAHQATHTTVPVQEALVFGNPSTSGDLGHLALSEAEATRIGALYQPSIVATAHQATRALLAREAGRSLVVHFAGHASMAPTRGAAAALAFAGKGGTDFVKAYEIASMHFPSTRLVALAACDTFAGTREHVEGTPTLAHAFLTAGVPSVIGTLWPIDDTAAHDLFGRFHAEARKGIDLAAALRTAQLALLGSADAQLRHPAAWAGVELLGNPQPLTIAERRTQ